MAKDNTSSLSYIREEIMKYRSNYVSAKECLDDHFRNGVCVPESGAKFKRSVVSPPPTVGPRLSGDYSPLDWHVPPVKSVLDRSDQDFADLVAQGAAVYGNWVFGFHTVGKSTLVDLLRHGGYHMIDTDEIGKELFSNWAPLAKAYAQLPDYSAMDRIATLIVREIACFWTPGTIVVTNLPLFEQAIQHGILERGPRLFVFRDAEDALELAIARGTKGMTVPMLRHRYNEMLAYTAAFHADVRFLDPRSFLTDVLRTLGKEDQIIGFGRLHNRDNHEI